jgi:hypothetical protein
MPKRRMPSNLGHDLGAGPRTRDNGRQLILQVDCPSRLQSQNSPTCWRSSILPFRLVSVPGRIVTDEHEGFIHEGVSRRSKAVPRQATPWEADT